MKARRQALILELLGKEPVRNQEQLRNGLKALGVVATQATLSRDIKELGLLKRSSDGAYQPSGVDAAAPASALGTLSRTLSEYLLSVEAVQQLVVVKTGTGQAQILAVAIDRARLPEIAGTLAGDDTILIIARDPQSAQAVVTHLRDLAS